MRIYLAGPMTGHPEFNYPLFNEYAGHWRAEGYDVINPAERDGGRTDLPYEQYMRGAVRDVANADAVAVLSGWETSGGARMEMTIAKQIGMPIYDARSYASPQILAPDLFREELESIYELHAAKRADYTAGHHPLANYRFAGEMLGLGARDAMFMRLCEKVYRLRSLRLNGGAAAGMDSATDTYRDIAVIAVLSLLNMQPGSPYGG